jgi:hypothetical protein
VHRSDGAAARDVRSPSRSPVMAITEEGTCSCQPKSCRSVVATRQALPHVTRRIVCIDKRTPSLGPAIQRRRRRTAYETAARVACCSRPDTDRSAAHQSA